jgi:MFS family permease
VGTWAGVASGGAVLGLLLSGTLVEITEWRWVFAANGIWALLALTLALRWVPRSRDADQPPLDYVGALLSTAGLSAAVFATIEGPERGWTDGLIVGGFIAGAVLLAGFVLWELRRTHPMLDPRLFALRGFRTGSLSMTLQFFALFGFIFAILQYLQLVLDYSPLAAAFALIPLGMFVGMMSRIVAPRLMNRFGHRVVDAAGLAVLAGGFAALATLGTNSSYWHILAALAPLAVGIGLATAPATASIVQSLPPEKQGVASAVNDAAREVGGAVGIAVLGSVLNAGYRSGIEEHLTQLPPEGAERARDALSFVVSAAESANVPGPVRQAATELLPAARDAFVSGLSLTMTIAAVVMVAGSLLVFGRGRRSGRRPELAVDTGTGDGQHPTPRDHDDLELVARS